MPQSITGTEPEMRRVLRPIGGAEGKVHQPGEVVDVSQWRNTRRLIDERRLSPDLVRG